MGGLKARSGGQAGPTAVVSAGRGGVVAAARLVWVATATASPASPPPSPRLSPASAEVAKLLVAVARVVAVRVVRITCGVLVTTVAVALFVVVDTDDAVVRQASAPPRRSNSCQFTFGLMVPGAGRALLSMHRRMRAM